MRSVDKFDRKAADLDLIARRDAMQQHIVEHVVFAEPFFRQRQRKTRGINRQIEFTENVRECTYVVFMAMGKDNRRQIVAIFFEKIEIWDRDIDPERRFLRKTHSRIDDDHLIPITTA